MELSVYINPNRFLDHDRIVFTDAAALDGVEVEDLSLERDGGVVGWLQDDTYYVSTQREGVRVVIPACDDIRLFTAGDMVYVDVAMLDVSQLTSLAFLFMCCDKLVTIDGLDTWDVSHITDMGMMFACCTALKNINGLSGWDTHNVTDMGFMFDGCTSLENLSNIENWDVFSLTNACAMFAHCPNIDDAILSQWDLDDNCDQIKMFG
jgi:surface protein